MIKGKKILFVLLLFSNHLFCQVENRVKRIENREDSTKTYSSNELIPRDVGIAFEFFSGYSMFSGQLHDYYTNNIPYGVAFDISYKNVELFLRDYIGFNKTQQNRNYSNGIWKKGSKTLVSLPEVSLGYAAYNNDRFKLSPFAGIGSMKISPTTYDTNESPELKEFSLAYTTTYILGFNFDVKFKSKTKAGIKPSKTCGFIRIRYGYSFPRFEKKYDITGTMQYITIGFGAMGRGLKRNN